MESGQSPHTKGVNGEDKGGTSGIVSVGHAPHKKGSQRVEEWNCPKEDKRSLHGEKMGQKYKKMVKKRACDVKREESVPDAVILPPQMYATFSPVNPSRPAWVPQ